MKTWEKFALGCLGCLGITVVGIGITCAVVFKGAQDLQARAKASAPSSLPTGNSAASSTKPSSQWQYETSADPMGRGDMKFAHLESSNTLEFGFPYQGPQHATLTLRTRAGRNEVILDIERGQFLAGVEGTSVEASFDGGKPVRFHAVAPSDHSTTTLFIDNYPAFLSRLKAAKKVNLEVVVYQEGSQVISFDCGGLEWPK